MNLLIDLKDRIQKHFADPHEEEKELIDAAKKRRFSRINDLFSRKNDIDINYRNEEGLTALHCAAFSGGKDIAIFLIGKGADINARTCRQETPLHYAALKNHVKIINLLIIKKAEVDPRNEGAYTPLHYAAEKGNLEALELLIKKGADVNAVSKKNRWTPLHMAINEESKSVVQCLIQNGAFVDECAIKLAKQQGNNMLFFLQDKVPSSGSKEVREKGIDEKEKEQATDEDAEIQFEKGKAEIIRKDYLAAIDFILKAVKIKNKSKNNKGITRYHYQLAFCYLAIADYPNTSFYFRNIIKFFEDKLKTEPDKDAICFNLQIAYLKPFTTTSFIGDDKALKYIKKVKNELRVQNSKNPQFYGQLGVTYYNIHKMKKAIKYLKESLSNFDESNKSDEYEWWCKAYQYVLNLAYKNLECENSLPTRDDPKSYEFFQTDSEGFKFAIRSLKSQKV